MKVYPGPAREGDVFIEESDEGRFGVFRVVSGTEVEVLAAGLSHGEARELACRHANDVTAVFEVTRESRDGHWVDCGRLGGQD